ncbi:MAG TPA: thiamine pyrophosphate-dependent enzyme [Bryobacteraceae bacterium]|jgi:pyruvate dehydrogenase (quinone)|nr:thiamine pyrophosphate-dependent enzyme [Bryobacteraceae bacterium]
MAKTVGERLIERLSEWGVDTIFGFPGDGVNGIFEGLRLNQKKVRFVQVRHEEAAAFAACGYAKYTGRLGVCIATSGPGGIHLLNGLYDAKCDGQPVLAITGHTFHDLIGTHYQQDVDLDKLYIDVSVYNQRVMGPAHLVNVLDEAVKTALSRRGVAHITVPKDIQDLKVSENERSSANIRNHTGGYFAPVYPAATKQELEDAAEILNKGKNIVILAGRGCLGARSELLEISERLGAPIVKPLLGKAVVPDRDPHCLGGIGLLGTAPSQDALEECDTILLAGTSFPYMEFLPKPGQAKCVQIDVDPARIGLRYPVDVGIASDAKSTLAALIPLLKKKSHDFLKKSQRRMESWNKLMEERGTRSDMPLKPQVVTHTLNKLLNNDAIVSSDSGTIATWSARYIDIRGDMQFSLSGSLATMANGLPYSIGAAIAYPGRQVVCIVGDGGVSMLMAELATLAKYRLNVKVIVVNNSTLGQIKWEQMVINANPEFGVDLEPIDFAGVAKSCGIMGYTLRHPGQAETVLRDALAHPGPALVDAIVDPQEPPMPGKIKTEQAIHFAEALLKGDKDAGKIIKTIAEDKVREVV